MQANPFYLMAKKIFLTFSLFMVLSAIRAQVGLNLSGAAVISNVSNAYIKFNPDVSYGFSLGFFFRTSERVELSLDYTLTGGIMSANAYSFQSDNISPTNLGTKETVAFHLGYEDVSFSTRVYLVPDVLSIGLGLHLLSFNQNIAGGELDYYFAKEDRENKPFTGEENQIPFLESSKFGGGLGVYIEPVKHIQLYVKYLRVFGSVFQMSDFGRPVNKHLDDHFGNVVLSQIHTGIQFKLYRRGKSTRF